MYSPPQTIIPWIVTILFAEKWKDTKSYALLAAPLVLCATFPLIGIAILMLGGFTYKLLMEHDKEKAIRVRPYAVDSLTLKNNRNNWYSFSISNQHLKWWLLTYSKKLLLFGG